MRKIKIVSLILATVMMTSVFAGCTSDGKPDETGKDADPASTTVSEDTPAETERDFQKLSMYLMGSPVNELDRISEKANAIIKEKINAELELILVDGYPEKINLMIGSGEKFDMCFMGAWGGINFWENANKGAFVDLTEMIPQYAPQSYSRIPEGLWDGVKVNGKIMGIVNYQQWGVASRKGFAVRWDMAEEFGFDWKALKGKDPITAFKMLDPFIGQVKAKYPEMIGWETSSAYTFFTEAIYWGMDAIGDAYTPGWVRFNDPTKVFNQYDTKEFRDYCAVMRDYYNKDYVRKDGATLKDTLPDRKAAKLIAAPAYGWPDAIDFPPTGVTELTLKGYKDAGVQIGDMSQVTDPGKAPCISVSTTETIIPAAAASTACVSISTTSTDPVRALECIELLNTNDELYNLYNFGEEGVDFEFLTEDRVTDTGTTPKGAFVKILGKYDFNWNEWQIGQSYSPTFARSNVAKNQDGEDNKKKMQIVFDADKTAKASPVSGFNFNTDPVKTEIASCSAIITEMIPAFSNGSIDPETNIPKFLKRLEDAGVAKVIAEKQAQYDAFMAAKG